jgi:hypothetical protein
MTRIRSQRHMKKKLLIGSISQLNPANDYYRSVRVSFFQFAF